MNTAYVRPDRLDGRRPAEGRSRWPSPWASRAEAPGLEPNPADRAGLGHDQPDRHGQRLRHHRQRRCPPRLVHRQEGDPGLGRQGALARSAQDRTGCCPRTSPPTSAMPCSRSSRAAPASNALGLGRPAAGKTGTATNDDGDVSSSWFVGYTPQVATAVMYVARQGQRGAQRVPAVVLRRRLPGLHVAAIMERDDGRHRGRGLPAAGVRRRRGARRGPRAVHPAAAARAEKAKPKPKPKPKPHADPGPGHRAAAPRPRPSHPDAGTGGGGGGGGGGARPSLRPGGPELRPVTPTPDRRGRVVAPTRTDPFARSMSEVVGGPVGRHGRPHRWWTPVRVLLALFAVVFALSLVHHVPVHGDQLGQRPGPLREDVLLRRALPLHRAGLRRGPWPYADSGGRFQVMEYPVGISYLAFAAAGITQLYPSGPPDAQRQAVDLPAVVAAGDDRRGQLLLPGDRAAAVRVRPDRDLVPGRRPSWPAVGRAAVRAVARACWSPGWSTGT